MSSILYDMAGRPHAGPAERPSQKPEDIPYLMTCQKVRHNEHSAYMHPPDDDGPYSVDGVKYCGRCHTYMSWAWCMEGERA